MTEGPPEATEDTQGSRDPVQRLVDALGYTFSDPTLMAQALTHRSFVNEVDDPDVRDNERLEFLGDAVLDLVVSVALMGRFPDAREGQLSKMRAAVVSERGLARIARRLSVGPALRLGRGEEMSGGREKPSILSDAFEAIVAAIYLDGGFEEASKVLLSRLPLPSDDSDEHRDPKTELQHRVQAERHITPTYRLVAEEGPEHAKRFVVEIMIGGQPVAVGEGRTKKQAEQQAAARALEAMGDGPDA